MLKLMRPFALKTLMLPLFVFAATLGVNAQNAVSRPASEPAPEVIQAEQEADEAAAAKEMKLSKEQRDKIKQINADYKKQREAAKAQQKAQKADHKAAMKQAREERIRAHKAVMTPEQARQYDEILAKKEAKRAEKAAQKAEKNAGKPQKGKAKGKKQ
jgi:hypothetical protein